MFLFRQRHSGTYQHLVLFHQQALLPLYPVVFCPALVLAFTHGLLLVRPLLKHHLDLSLKARFHFVHLLEQCLLKGPCCGFLLGFEFLAFELGLGCLVFGLQHATMDVEFPMFMIKLLNLLSQILNLLFVFILNLVEGFPWIRG